MKITKIFNGIVLKKLIKIAGYQGKESVHTRAMQKFISLIKNNFQFLSLRTLHQIIKKLRSYKSNSKW